MQKKNYCWKFCNHSIIILGILFLFCLIFALLKMAEEKIILHPNKCVPLVQPFKTFVLVQS